MFSCIPDGWIKPSPLYTPIILLLIFFWKCYSAKIWPDIRKLVELIAYSTTIYFMVILVSSAFKYCVQDTNVAIGLLTAAVVTGTVTIQGIWDIIYSIHKRSKFNLRIKNTRKNTERRN